MFFQNLVLGAFILAPFVHIVNGSPGALTVRTHVNTDLSSDMVSSLIIGSQAAMIVDLPLAIPQAKELAAWIKNTTDKPLVAAFSTHFHPDHFLSGHAVLESFPGVHYYANSAAVGLIRTAAPHYVTAFSSSLGKSNIVQNTIIPTPYDFTFFTLPGDEDSPIHLLSPLCGDTADETIFWIPSIETLIAGDTVYNNDIHVWLADQRTPELTTAWLATLDLIDGLKATTIIPGHSAASGPFNGKVRADLNYTRTYLEFWQKNIESRGPNYFTPQEIFDAFSAAFPSSNNSTVSKALLNATSEEFGRNGTGIPTYVDLAGFNNTAVLDGWIL